MKTRQHLLTLTLALAATSPLAAAPPTDAECESRVNDSTERLLECIQQPGLWRHMEAFQAIADAHPDAKGHGNRDLGTAGYKASVDYVAAQMRAAGYRVTVQSYPYTTQQALDSSTMQMGGRRYALHTDWHVARLSAGGRVTAPLSAVGGSGSGCVGDEFNGFTPGHIALLQRGACGHDQQVHNAQAAGARAVVLYN